MNIKAELERIGTCQLQFNDIEVEPEKIKAILINEVVPAFAMDDFYGQSDAQYLTTTIPLFQNAGLNIESVDELLDFGIYLTNAVKRPKSNTTIPKESIEESLPYLEKELSLFPNLKVIMLMGDVAKKAFNMITKKESGKNAIPAISTYKIRHTKIYYKDIRVMPSYIITGQNILIEKSKFAMASEDMAIMYDLING